MDRFPTDTRRISPGVSSDSPGVYPASVNQREDNRQTHPRGVAPRQHPRGGLADPPRVLISTHAVLVGGKAVHGPAHILYDFLHDRDITTKLIELPLSSGMSQWPRQVRHVIDEARAWKPTVYIGIDPLNGWTGKLMKQRGLISRFVYHTPDYSPKRFGFAPLNWVYHWIDRRVLAAADDAWTVSSRITTVRRKQGRKDARTIVNGIVFDPKRVPRFDAERRFEVIFVGNLNQTMDLEMLLDVVAELKDKYPKLQLHVVGEGKGRAELEQKATQLAIGNHVTFHGNQPLSEVLGLLQKAGIGLALYSGSAGFNWYGDSKKIREYSAIGLPVITTPIVVNAQEITKYGAGEVVEPTYDGLLSALTKLFDDKALYQRERDAAIKLAQDTDLESVLEEACRSIGVL